MAGVGIPDSVISSSPGHPNLSGNLPVPRAGPRGASSMNAVCRFAIAAALTAAAAPAARAQQAQQPPATPPQQQGQKPEQKPERKPEEAPKYEETVVVSASRTEEKLVNAPATMSVIGSQALESAPTQHFAELLRAVPGLNITQVSARDINIPT